jgi:hypothetical protein
MEKMRGSQEGPDTDCLSEHCETSNRARLDGDAAGGTRRWERVKQEGSKRGAQNAQPGTYRGSLRRISR